MQTLHERFAEHCEKVKEVVDAPIRRSEHVIACERGGGVKKIVMPAADTKPEECVRMNTVENDDGSYTVLTTSCGRAGCQVSDVRMARCSRCKTTPYCTKECQRADWKVHKQRCKSLAETRGSDQSDVVPTSEMKWFLGLRNVLSDLRICVRKSPRKDVPVFLVEGGSNPHVAAITEWLTTDEERRVVCSAKPSFAVWIRDDSDELEPGFRRVAVMLHRNGIANEGSIHRMRLDMN